MYDFHDSTDTLKFWTEKRLLIKLSFSSDFGEIVVHMNNYNFTKFHQNRMKNKNVLLIAHFSVQNFKVSVESWKSHIVTWVRINNNTVVIVIYCCIGRCTTYLLKVLTPTGALKDAFNTWASLVDFLFSVVGLSIFLFLFEFWCGLVLIRVRPAFCDCWLDFHRLV